MIVLPDKKFLQKTGEVDYYNWNYKFPISLIQKYRFKRIVKLLGQKKYPKLLEVGTGSGIFIPELSKHCNSLYACDIHNNYDHIRNLCDHYGISDYNVYQQNIERTTYPDNFFDVIIAASVLEFVNNIQNAIDEIKRILKPEGIFITICPMQNNLLDSVLSFYSSKKPMEEFGNSRTMVTKKLEENFCIINKGYMLPIIGKWFPIYTHYKLSKYINLIDYDCIGGKMKLKERRQKELKALPIQNSLEKRKIKWDSARTNVDKKLSN